MSHTPIARLPVEDTFIHACRNAGIQDLSDLFTLPEYCLIERLNLTPIKLHNVLAQIAIHCAPQPRSALDLLTEQEEADLKTEAGRPSSGVEIMTSAAARASMPWFLPLRLELFLPALQKPFAHPPKGLHIGSGIVEIVGGSGTGKTQTCHHLAMQVALSGLQGELSNLDPDMEAQDGVIYISSGSHTFSVTRLQQLIQSYTSLPADYLTSVRFPTLSTNKEGPPDSASGSLPATGNLSSTSLDHALSRIFVYTETDLPSMIRRVRELEQIFVEQRIQLLIIDALDAVAMKPIPSVEAEKQIVQRHVLLLELAAMLKHYSFLFGVKIVVANQLSLRAGFTPNAAGIQDSNNDDRSVTDLLRQIIHEARIRWANPSQSATAPLPASLRLSSLLERIVGSRLGIGWSHAVTDRIALFAVESQTADKRTTERVAVLVKSPKSAAHTIRFEIKDSGCHYVS